MALYNLEETLSNLVLENKENSNSIHTQQDQAERIRKFYEKGEPFFKKPAVSPSGLDPITSGVISEEVQKSTFEDNAGGESPTSVDTEVTGGEIVIPEEDEAVFKAMVEEATPNVEPEILIENLEKIKEEAMQNIHDIYASHEEFIRNQKAASLAQIDKVFDSINDVEKGFNDWKQNEQSKLDEQIAKIEETRKTVEEAKEMVKEANEAMQQSSPAPTMPATEPYTFPSLPESAQTVPEPQNDPLTTPVESPAIVDTNQKLTLTPPGVAQTGAEEQAEDNELKSSA